MTEPVYFLLALLMTAGVTYLIRLLPLLFVRHRIENRFIKSFLYYVPYVVLSVLTFPAIFLATEHLASGIIAAAVCVILAYFGRGLVVCMLGGSAAVLLTELIIMLL